MAAYQPTIVLCMCMIVLNTCEFVYLYYCSKNNIEIDQWTLTRNAYTHCISNTPSSDRHRAHAPITSKSLWRVHSTCSNQTKFRTFNQSQSIFIICFSNDVVKTNCIFLLVRKKSQFSLILKQNKTKRIQQIFSTFSTFSLPSSSWNFTARKDVVSRLRRRH